MESTGLQATSRLIPVPFGIGKGWGYSIGRIWVGLLFLGLIAPAPVLVNAATDQAELIRAAIADLGDPNYFVRDEAEAKLIKLGGPAIPFLRRALTHRDAENPDNEIRLRASRLLILIERTEHQRQLREFLAGSDDPVDLVGWESFSEIVGTDKPARQLFVSMHKSRSELLKAIAKGKSAVEELFQDVARRSLRSSSNGSASRSIGSLTAVLFVSTLELPSESGEVSRIRVSDFDLRRIQSVLNQPQMLTFINSGGSKRAMDQLISRWLETLPNDTAQSVNVQLAVIEAHELINQLDLVWEIAANREIPVQARVAALEVISQLGTPRITSRLETLFSEPTVIGNFLPRVKRAAETRKDADGRPLLMEVRISDVALIAAIYLNKKEPTDFGFLEEAMSDGKLVRNHAGFFSDAERKQAQETWLRQRASISEGL